MVLDPLHLRGLFPGFSVAVAADGVEELEKVEEEVDDVEVDGQSSSHVVVRAKLSSREDAIGGGGFHSLDAGLYSHHHPNRQSE